MSRALGAALILLALSAAAGAQTPEGQDFQVNTYTPGEFLGSGAISSAPDGRFVVLWRGNRPDDSDAVFGQRYDAAGARVGPEFKINTYTTGSQRVAAVASAPDGRFVVVWLSDTQDGDRGGVFGQRFDASGDPVGSEFRVNTYTTGSQHLPSVAIAANGSFVVAWQSLGQDGNGYGVYAQRFDAAGAAQDGEFRVNVTTLGQQSYPKVAAAADGRFVVVWRGLDGDDWGTFGRRYDADGAAQGSEFRLSTVTTGFRGVPSVASAPDGRFVAAWSESDGNDSGVLARRYDGAGTAQGAPFVVNAYTTNRQQTPAVSMTAEGGFVVAWESRGQASTSPDIFVRRFDARGTPEAPEVHVNTVTTFSQNFAAVAAAANGRFVVVWYSNRQHALFGRRYAPSDLIFADDFESGSLSAWSASTTDGGDLTVSADAAMKSTTMGLETVVENPAAVHLQDNSPVDENRYRARFYFDTNGFDPGESLDHRRVRLLVAFEESPIRRLAQIVLRRLGGAYAILARVRLDDDTLYDTPAFPITGGEHFVELDWTRASGPDTLDGGAELWIDGSSVHAVTSLDNNRSAVDFVRLGAISVKAGASGTLLFDEFESRRNNAIGP